jgi:hypothetical protein
MSADTVAASEEPTVVFASNSRFGMPLAVALRSLEQGSLAWVVEDHEAMVAAIASPSIVHFNFSQMGRPWDPRCRHPLRSRWFEVLDATPWSGWRPREPREDLASRAGRRLARTVRTLIRGR